MVCDDPIGIFLRIWDGASQPIGSRLQGALCQGGDAPRWAFHAFHLGNRAKQYRGSLLFARPEGFKVGMGSRGGRRGSHGTEKGKGFRACLGTKADAGNKIGGAPDSGWGRERRAALLLVLFRNRFHAMASARLRSFCVSDAGSCKMTDPLSLFLPDKGRARRKIR